MPDRKIIIIFVFSSYLSRSFTAYLEVWMVQRKLLIERHIYYMYSTYEISVSGRLALPLVNEYGFEEKWGSGRVFGAEIRF